jgi:hypothetical protein
MKSGPSTIHRLKEINPNSNTKKRQAGVACAASAQRNEKPFFKMLMGESRPDHARARCDGVGHL